MLVKETKSGIEEPVVIKNQIEELKCTTERSYPPADFDWRYQNLECKPRSKCKPVKPNKWRKIASFVGKVEQRSSNTSVLVVPGNIDNMYFKCIAVNPENGQLNDYKVYKFQRRGKLEQLRSVLMWR